MSVKTLHGYMSLCRYYGWTPTWQGLKAFASGVRIRTLGGASGL